MEKTEITKETQFALRSQDIQTGLQDYEISEYEMITKVGMATRLAIHIRGGESIDYEKLKEIGHVLFGIPKIGFAEVINILREVSHIKTIDSGGKVKKVIPQVPYFDDLYDDIGEYALEDGVNEIETLAIQMLDRLAENPFRLDKLRKQFSADKEDFERVLEIGEVGTFIKPLEYEGNKFIISPLYFGENSEGFVRILQEHGSTKFKAAFEILRRYPGLPLSKIQVFTDDLEVQDILRAYVNYGCFQPPKVNTTRSGSNFFLFTPSQGTQKIKIIEKEVYEKVLALIASVRQGEHFASDKIREPIKILYQLFWHKKLARHPESLEQYAPLALLRVCKLVKESPYSYELVFIDTPENNMALGLAINMLEGNVESMPRGLDTKAVYLIQSDINYEESLRGYRSLIKEKRVRKSKKATINNLTKLIELASFGG